MASQSVTGNQNVQILGAVGSTIQVSIGGGPRRQVPLEPAVVPVGKKVRSPARLVRARSGVVPFAVRADLLQELVDWLGDPDPFAGRLIGGRGGSGKTRLGVELCRCASEAGWLSGLLARTADPAELETLVEAPGALMGADDTKVAVGNRSVSRPRERIQLSRRSSSLRSWLTSAVNAASEATTFSASRCSVTEPAMALVRPTASLLAGRPASFSRTRYPTTDSGLGLHLPSTSPERGAVDASSAAVDTRRRSGEDGVRRAGRRRRPARWARAPRQPPRVLDAGPPVAAQLICGVRQGLETGRVVLREVPREHLRWSRRDLFHQ